MRDTNTRGYLGIRGFGDDWEYFGSKSGLGGTETRRLGRILGVIRGLEERCGTRRLGDIWGIRGFGDD